MENVLLYFDQTSTYHVFSQSLVFPNIIYCRACGLFFSKRKHAHRKIKIPTLVEQSLRYVPKYRYRRICNMNVKTKACSPLHFMCNQTWLEAGGLVWAQMFNDSAFYLEFPFFNPQQSNGEQEPPLQLTTWVLLATNFPLFAAQLANVNQQKKAHWLLKLICWANNHCESNLFLSLK